MKERTLLLLIAALALLAVTSRSHYALRSTSGLAHDATVPGSAPIAIGARNPAVETIESTTVLPPVITSWWRRLGTWLWRHTPVSGTTISNANAAAPFTISRLEVTQAVQNLAEPVPLIAGKATIVRAYLESRQGDAASIWGTLYVSGDNGRTWMALQPENAKAPAAVAAVAFDRAGDDHALRFTLAPALARGTLLLSLHTYLGAGEQWQRSNQLALSFDETAPFRIAYLPLQFDGAWPETERISRAHTYMEMIYPVAQVDYFPLPYAVPYLGSRAGDQVTHFLRRLYTLYQYTGWPQAVGEPDQLFGWAPHTSWRLDGRADPYWFNNGSSQVAFGTDSPANKAYQVILAHEIGHNLGRQHPICDYTATDWPHPTYAIYDVGFDFGFYGTTTPFVQQSADDFMIGSNCGADIYANKWISAHNYQKLHESLAGGHFRSGTATPLVAGEPVAAGTDTALPVYLVSGRVHNNGRAEFDTIYQVTASGSLSQQSGDYCLVLENSQGETASDTCFDLSLADAQRYNRPATFIYPLAYVPDASRLALRRGGELLAQRPFSANMPIIELISPAPGTVLPDVVELSWNGRDADGDPLSYILSYSPDGGGSWYHLAYEFRGNRLAIDMTQLPGGEQALFRLMASDGGHTAVAVAGPFHVVNRAPQPFILLPEKEISLYQGQTLLLSGYGYDLEDGLLAEAELHWSSDLSGYLGSGRKIVARDLPAGRHLITLTASDSSSESATATVPLEVR